jgi:alpha-beta hydrolase superfamily lysophospholipase
MEESEHNASGRQVPVEVDAGGNRLRGTLHLPAGDCHALVIGCHGLLSDAESPKQVALADGCNAVGLAYLRFDHRGRGRSGGVFSLARVLEDRTQDLMCVIETVSRRTDVGSGLGLFGSSMGGTVCLAVAARCKPAAVVTCAAPVRSRSLPGGADSGLNFDISEHLPNVRGVLVFHGDADEVVPFDDAREILRRAGIPKRLVRQPDGDHRMSRPGDQKEFQRESVAWFGAALVPP